MNVNYWPIDFSTVASYFGLVFVATGMSGHPQTSIYFFTVFNILPYTVIFPWDKF